MFGYIEIVIVIVKKIVLLKLIPIWWKANGNIEIVIDIAKMFCTIEIDSNKGGKQMVILNLILILLKNFCIIEFDTDKGA